MRFLLTTIMCFVILLLCLSSPAFSRNSKETGQVPEVLGGISLWNSSAGEYQFVAVRVEGRSDTLLRSLDVWMKICQPGTVVVTLYGNRDNSLGVGMPGEPLQVEYFEMGSSTNYRWHSFSGLNWSIPPGQYWISFEPEAGFSANLEGANQESLSSYALLNDMKSAWQNQNDFTVSVQHNWGGEEEVAAMHPAIQLLLFDK